MTKNSNVTEHTKGPWRVDAHMNVVAAGGLVTFPGVAAGFDQAANARLIAAAPELLDALISADEAFKSSTKAMGGRVFSISLKGIPRVDASTKARLEAAARSPSSKRRDYPQLTKGTT